MTSRVRSVARCRTRPMRLRPSGWPPYATGRARQRGPKKKSRGQEPRRASTSSQPAGLEEVEAALSQHISTLDPGEIPTLDFGLARLVRQLVRERRNGGSPEPPTQALDPALLDDTVERIRRHLIVADEQADAMALWVLGAHAFDWFDVSPPLHIASPVRRTGKTRALDTLGMLVPKPWDRSSSPAKPSSIASSRAHSRRCSWTRSTPSSAGRRSRSRGAGASQRRQPTRHHGAPLRRHLERDRPLLHLLPEGAGRDGRSPTRSATARSRST